MVNGVEEKVLSKESSPSNTNSESEDEDTPTKDSAAAKQDSPPKVSSNANIHVSSDEKAKAVLRNKDGIETKDTKLNVDRSNTETTNTDASPEMKASTTKNKKIKKLSKKYSPTAFVVLPPKQSAKASAMERPKSFVIKTTTPDSMKQGKVVENLHSKRDVGISKQEQERKSLTMGSKSHISIAKKPPPPGFSSNNTQDTKSASMPVLRHPSKSTGTTSSRQKVSIDVSNLKIVNKEDNLQPLANSMKEYYLHDDHVLVEEDQLPPRPAGKYTFSMLRNSSLPPASSEDIHFLPPRSIGGLQDQVHVTQGSCKCKVKKGHHKNSGAACLKLYCTCFAMGLLCNVTCSCSASCFNNTAEENEDARTEAIAQALSQDPNVFRSVFDNIGDEQKQHRERTARAEARAAKARKLNPRPKLPEHINTEEEVLNLITLPPMPKRRRRRDYDADRDEPTNIPPAEILTTQLPPSFYTVPLKPDKNSAEITGLSFSLTHPSYRKRKARQRVEHLKHNLMLSSTDTADSPASTSPIGSTGATNQAVETDLEMYWKKQNQSVNDFFGAMRSELGITNESEINVSNEVKEQAKASVNSLKKEMEGIQAVLQASRIDTMSRFFKEKRLEPGYNYAPAVDMDQSPLAATKSRLSNDIEQLQCKEKLEPIKPEEPIPDEADLKELTLLAAQDTALLQEVARLIRKSARELSERRILKSS